MTLLRASRTAFAPFSRPRYQDVARHTLCPVWVREKQKARWWVDLFPPERGGSRVDEGYHGEDESHDRLARKGERQRRPAEEDGL